VRAARQTKWGRAPLGPFPPNLVLFVLYVSERYRITLAPSPSFNFLLSPLYRPARLNASSRPPRWSAPPTAPSPHARPATDAPHRPSREQHRSSRPDLPGRHAVDHHQVVLGREPVDSLMACLRRPSVPPGRRLRRSPGIIRAVATMIAPSAASRLDPEATSFRTIDLITRSASPNGHLAPERLR
jgi:hypothetical protein